MAPVGACPAAEAIEAFLRGPVSLERRAELEAHLEACPACRRVAVRLVSLTATPADTPTTDGTSPLSPARPPDAAGELHRGDRVGRHIVIGRLGAGGMGTVYAAFDTTLERKIALKFLSSGRRDQAASRRLMAEASAMARLNHPNVVRIHDVGLQDDRPYLAMEYVQGQTLGQWRRERPRSVREILDVMAAVAQGLEAAHAAGIIHRDVKPDNVLVAGRRVLVTDFGLSVRADLGEAGTVAGTPAYMAPEQFAGDAATRATDVFGFSVSLYELLYEQHPFDGSDASADLRTRVLAGQVQPPPARPRVPRHVQRLMMAGLAVDPSARPASMNSLATALLSAPARQARRVGLGLLAVAAAAAAFRIGGHLEADPERRCQAGADVLAAAWNADRRQELGRHYQTLGQASTWPLVARRFDEYAGAWRDQHAQTCRAAFGDQRISGELFDLRMSCLDGHRAGLAALLESMPKASASQLAKVAATSLPPVAECAISDRQFIKPLPPDPGSRKRITDINDLLARTEAALTLGELVRARKLATDAAAAARSLGYEPLLSRALNHLAAVELKGSRLARTGERSDAPPESMAPDRAAKLLEESAQVADRGRDDASRAEAANALVLAHRDAGRLTEAERWAEMASATINRLGDPPLLRAGLEHAIGGVYWDRRQTERAERVLDHALELRRRHLGPRSPEVLATMTARCHMMKRDPRIACYRGAIALARDIGGPRHPDLIRLQANLAQMLSEDSRTRPQACRMLAEAVELEKQTFDPNFGAVLFSMQLLAQCQRDQGQIDESLRIYKQAISWATHPTGPRGDLYQDYAVFMMMRKDWPEAIKYLKASIADRELVYGPTNTRPIETRVRLGDTYRRAGNTDEALKELDAAIATCESAGATPRAYPELYQTKGHALMWIGRKEEGYHNLKRGLELHRAIGTPPGDHYETLTSLGEVESRLGKLDDAIEHLQQAMELETLEAAPVYHAVPALYLAGAFLKKGKAFWPKGCEAARRAFAGYSSPFGASLTTDLAETRKIMTKLRCPPPPAS